jgi:hypothetical protein
VTKLLVPVLHFIHDGRKDPASIGLVHLGTFVLLALSAERDFCVALNKPFVRTVRVARSLLFRTGFASLTGKPSTTAGAD